MSDATTDEQVVRGWFEQGDEYNIGIATGEGSNLVVVDLDTGKGADAEAFADKFDLSASWWADCVSVQTGRGLHLYFTYPTGQNVRNSASQLGRFIDVRGEGGYVVAPPSVHASGTRYDWGQVDDPGVIPPALPPSILRSLQPSNDLLVPPKMEPVMAPVNVESGERNTILTSVAGMLRKRGLSYDSIIGALLPLNAEQCNPPLPEAEVRSIAKSVMRYDGDLEITDVYEAEDDPLTTVRALYGSALAAQQYAPKPVIALHMARGDMGIIQAPTNAGKTTFLRNLAVSMAAKRPFTPFYDAEFGPVKICYFDFENDEEDIQADVMKMCSVLTPEEYDSWGKHFICVGRGLWKGDVFKFDNAQNYVDALISGEGVQAVICDNVSAAFDLYDENSNAEVSRKVIAPLTKMALNHECLMIVAHHYGKGVSEVEAASVHAGRGASNFQGLAKTVFNMVGSVATNEPVTIHCTKRKRQGGDNYSRAYILNQDRWFHPADLVVPEMRKLSAYETVRDFFVTHSDAEMTAADVISMYDTDFGAATLRKAIKDLAADHYLREVKRGIYQWNRS